MGILRNRPTTFPRCDEEFCLRILNSISFDHLKSESWQLENKKQEKNLLIYVATDSKILFDEAVKILNIKDPNSFSRDLSKNLPRSFENNVTLIILTNLDDHRNVDDLYKLEHRLTAHCSLKKGVRIILQGDKKYYDEIFKNEDSLLFELPTLEQNAVKKTEIFFNLLVKNGVDNDIENRDFIIRENLLGGLLRDFNSIDEMDYFISEKDPTLSFNIYRWYYFLDKKISVNKAVQHKYKAYIFEHVDDKWKITTSGESTKSYSYNNLKGIKFILFLYKYSNKNDRIDIRKLVEMVDAWHSKKLKKSEEKSVSSLIKSIKSTFAELNPEKRKKSKFKPQNDPPNPKEHPTLTELTSLIILGSECYFINPEEISITIIDENFPSKP